MTITRRFFKLAPSEMATQFSLKAPKHGRATFAVVKRTVDRSTLKTSNQTLKLPQIDSINAGYKAKHLSYESCLQLAKEVVTNLYEKEARLLPAVTHNLENLKLVEDYWEAEGIDRDIVSPYASKTRLKRAVEALGSVSLRSASKEALQRQVNQALSGNRQRDSVAALNQLMRFIERKDRLRKGREEVRIPRYLTEKELKSVAIHLPKEQSLVFQVAFGTGCRLGEIFAIEERLLNGVQLTIEAQMDEGLRLRRTKNRLVRRTLVLDPYLAAVKEWCRIPLAKRAELRNLAWSKIARKTCGVAKIGKNCVFHDLRHSYAIHLKERGASITEIAQTLGNSVVVCEKYYAGRAGTEESISNLSAKIRQQVPPS